MNEESALDPELGFLRGVDRNRAAACVAYFVKKVPEDAASDIRIISEIEAYFLFRCNQQHWISWGDSGLQVPGQICQAVREGIEASKNGDDLAIATYEEMAADA